MVAVQNELVQAAHAFSGFVDFETFTILVVHAVIIFEKEKAAVVAGETLI
jgi:hypothetical protein